MSLECSCGVFCVFVFFSLSLLLKRLSLHKCAEHISLNMVSICPDPDESCLSQFFCSILFLHISCEQDYSLVCHSSCSEKKNKKKKRRRERTDSEIFCLTRDQQDGDLSFPHHYVKTTAASDMYYKVSN